jgi:DNA end-binding protein Ku
MRAIWKGFISFGLVTIPVGLGVAQQKKDVSFRTLSRETGRPVKQKRWDEELDREVTAEEVVKGWEVSKGRYVTVEDEELERFAARQEKTIEILQFVELPEVDPVFFERAYWIEPQERAERPYALLLEAMERTGRAAIGRFVLSTKEHLVLLRPFGKTLTIETLYYPEDLRLKDQEEISQRIEAIEVREQELAMAEQLVEGLTKPFVVETLTNETRASLLDFLHAKAEGEEPVVAEPAAEPAPVVDLMAALKASLAAAGVGSDAEDEEEDEPRKRPAPKRGGGRTAKGKAKASTEKEKDQLSIEQGRLRRVEGGKRETAKAAGEEGAETPRRRSRKAS